MQCSLIDQPCPRGDCPGRSDPGVCRHVAALTELRSQPRTPVPVFRRPKIPAHARVRPITPRPTGLAKELVVAHYREDINWVAQAHCFATIYDKDHDLNLVDSDRWAGVRVIPLTNEGREGRTWLDHIIRHYDDLADWTYFAQGEPHQPPEEYLARLDYPYQDTTGLTNQYLPNFPPQWVKNTDLVEWHGPHEVRYGRAIHQGGRIEALNHNWLLDVWRNFFTCPTPNPLREWTYSYGAMYAVPKHRILARSLDFWKWCHDVIARPEHQMEHSWGSGYAFEVIWKYLWGDAEHYPVVNPSSDPNEAIIRADICRFASGPCGCGSGPPRLCSHPNHPPEVRRSYCIDSQRAQLCEPLDDGPPTGPLAASLSKSILV